MRTTRLVVVLTVCISLGSACATAEPDGTAAEQAVDMGVEIEEALAILQFKAQTDAATGNLAEVFGNRLLYGSYAKGKPEYVIYVTEIASTDAAWLDAVAAGGLGGTVTIEVAPGLAAPGGPCLDSALNPWGSDELFVAADGHVIEASLGSINIGYCPGDPRYGQSGLHGDGFYVTLGESILTAAPGAAVTVTAPDMPGAALTASLAIADEYPGEAGGRVWELIAPTDPGTYEIVLEPKWAEGNGRFKFHLVVADR